MGWSLLKKVILKNSVCTNKCIVTINIPTKHITIPKSASKNTPTNMKNTVDMTTPCTWTT